MVTPAPMAGHILQARSRIREAVLEYYFMLLGGHWRKVKNRLDGYTILMPVVPEFYPVTELNLRFLLSCDLTHCRELILVADSQRCRAENLSVISRHTAGPRIRYVVLTATKRLLLKLHRTPYVVHATNLTAGANLAAAEYLFLHDMDFFLVDSGYLEKVFHEMQRVKLNLVSAYTRNYPNGPTPAVYELMVRRDFLTSRPSYLLYGRTKANEWYSTLEWFYRQSANGKERLTESDIGIHFKHLFADYMEYKKGNGKVLDWYALFILHTLCAANTVAPRRLFKNVEACLGQIPDTAGAISAAVEGKYRLFCESRHLDNRERTFLLDSLQKAKAAAAFRQSGQRVQV